MIKYNHYILIAFLFSVIIMLGCNRKKKQIKYPEDTETSYLTPVERLKNKWWQLDYVSVNGKDYTDTVKKQIGSFKLYLTDYEHNFGLLSGSASHDSLIWGYNQFNISWGIDDEYFNFHSKIGHIHSDSTYSFVPYLFHPVKNSDFPYWRVRSLSSEVFKILCDYNDTLIINVYKTVQ